MFSEGLEALELRHKMHTRHRMAGEDMNRRDADEMGHSATNNIGGWRGPLVV